MNVLNIKDGIIRSGEYTTICPHTPPLFIPVQGKIQSVQGPEFKIQRMPCQLNCQFNEIVTLKKEGSDENRKGIKFTCFNGFPVHLLEEKNN